MKINKRSIRKSAIAAVATVLLGIASSCTDLWSEQHPGTFYISDGKTVANFLEDYEEDGEKIYSDFIYILKKMNLWEDLKTYGDRTVFAPDNKAISEYLQERQNAEKDATNKALFNSITTVPDSILDTIARTHLCRSSIYIKDLNSAAEGTLPSSNMLDRYLTFSIDYDSANDHIAYYINQLSQIMGGGDDSTVNGVVQRINHVISQSNQYIPGYLKSQIDKADKGHEAYIFYEALIATGLGLDNGELGKFIDDDYHKNHKPQYDSTFAHLEFTKKSPVKIETGNETDWVVWPEERYFKYTLFVVTDTILAHYSDKYTSQAGLNGIDSLPDLIKYAEEVYPEGKGKDPKDPESSIYKLISYHILPCFLPRSLMNFTDNRIVKDYKDYAAHCDMEDFYETLHPYAIMRISTPYDSKVNGGNGSQIYINRKGTLSDNNLAYKGIRIWSANETKEIKTTDALNGGYYYVDSLLLFDDHTKSALTTRIRVMGNTLSPDFINSGARGHMNVNKQEVDYRVYSFKDGFCKNFKVNNDQSLLVVRYQMDVWDIYMHDEMNIKGLFDFTLRLPPVPKDGTYEIRIFGNAQATDAAKKTRGIVQFLISEDGEHFTPLDIPVDMARASDHPLIGYVKDEDLKKDKSEEEGEKAVIANDKAMRNRGYMKAPGNFKVSATGGTNLRDNKNVFRKILCTQQFRAGQDYYLRFKQVKDSPESICQLNFIEIVPKEVFAGDIPEDIY